MPLANGVDPFVARSSFITMLLCIFATFTFFTAGFRSMWVGVEQPITYTIVRTKPNWFMICSLANVKSSVSLNYAPTCTLTENLSLFVIPLGIMRSKSSFPKERTCLVLSLTSFLPMSKVAMTESRRSFR